MSCPFPEIGMDPAITYCAQHAPSRHNCVTGCGGDVHRNATQRVHVARSACGCGTAAHTHTAHRGIRYGYGRPAARSEGPEAAILAAVSPLGPARSWVGLGLVRGGSRSRGPTPNNAQLGPSPSWAAGFGRRGFHFFNAPHINNRPLKPILSYAKLKLNRRVGRQRQPFYFVLPCGRQAISTHRGACIN
jgi:hypothetical protein